MGVQQIMRLLHCVLSRKSAKCDLATGRYHQLYSSESWLDVQISCVLGECNLISGYAYVYVFLTKVNSETTGLGPFSLLLFEDKATRRVKRIK